jgi:hypothetical protein
LPKSKDVALPVPSATRAQPDLSYLGPPALLAGEDAGGYEALLARVSATLAPQDALEDIWTRDVVDLTWDIFRLRRLKAALLQANAHRGLVDVLAPREALLPRGNASQTASQWACGDATTSAAVTKALEKSGLTMDAVRAQTFARHIDDIEQIDRMTMAAERRRDAMLRDLDRHRASFAQPLRRALGEAENAEFTVVGAESAA